MLAQFVWSLVGLANGLHSTQNSMQCTGVPEQSILVWKIFYILVAPSVQRRSHSE